MRISDFHLEERRQCLIDTHNETLSVVAHPRVCNPDCVPVAVPYVRKFSDKLQIEMLRAYKPDTFKTAGVNVNVGVKGDIFVLSEEHPER